MKIRVDYSNQQEKDKLLEAIREQFKGVKVRKDYEGKEGYKNRLYVDVEGVKIEQNYNNKLLQ